MPSPAMTHAMYLVECTGQGMGWADLDGKIAYMNPALRRMLDLSPQADIGGFDLRRFRPAEAEPALEEMLGAIRASGSWSEEVDLRSEHGRVLPTRHDIHLIRDDSGTPIAIACVISDLSQHKRHEQSLRESKSKYRALVENIPQRVFYKDIQSRYLAINRHYAADMGVSPRSMIGQDDYALHPRELADKYRADDQRVMDSGQAEEYDEPHYRDGKILTVHTIKTPVRGEHGQVIGICGIYWDVTEQQRIAAALREERNFSSAVLESAGTLILVLDREGRIRRFNRACKELSGYALSEVEGHFVWDFLLLPEDRERVRDFAFLAIAENPDALTGNYSNYWLDRAGGKHLIEWRNTALRDDQGQMEYLVSIGIDVTLQREVAAALKRSEETYAHAEAIAHLGSWDWDITSGELRWTDEIYRIFGLTPQSFGATYQAFLEAIHPDDRLQVIAAVNASIADPEIPYSVEHRVMRPNGEVRSVHERGKIYRDEQGIPIRMIGSVHDITERKRVEQELERHRNYMEDLVSERTAELQRLSQRNAMIANTAIDGFFSATMEGKLNDCNEAYCSMLGYTREEMLTLHFSDIEGIETPAELAAHVRKVLERGHDRFDTHHLRKDGRPIDVEVNVTVAQIGAERLLFAFAHDIGERKAAEAALIHARDEAERANRAKSEFLSRMSHELRTPLNAILGFGQLLERAKLAEVEADNVLEIVHAGHHLLELINEVLDLARIESGKFTINLEPVPLLPLIADCLGLIRPQAENSGIELSDTAAGCGVSVQADPTRLKQVLLNLLSNAVKYNRAQGGVSLSCKRLDGVFPGGAIQISVSDTGPGLSAEQQARLFVAFERLGAENTAVEGTGIGLALSKRLMELMGGEIGVVSTPGTGTTFWVRLPVAERPCASDTGPIEEAEASARAVSSKRYEVLCIEDNPANLRLIERILEMRMDIRLLKANAPDLGLELAHTRHPALILLDINLPDMDGYAVLQHLRENAATRDIPVIGISANAMPRDIERAHAAGFAEYLTKPLNIVQFLAVVNRFLDEPGDAP